MWPSGTRVNRTLPIARAANDDEETVNHRIAMRVRVSIVATFEQQLATTNSGRALIAQLTAAQLEAMRDVMRQTAANVAQAVSMGDQS